MMASIKISFCACLFLLLSTTAQEVSEEDVDSRFFNINLGDFGASVGASALGTVLGNFGTGLIQDCLGKRSVIMDRIVNKRSPQGEAAVRLPGAVSSSGESANSPDVQERLFCLGNNNNNYGRPNCNTCSCSRDNRCYNQCSKCFNNNNNSNNNYVDCYSCSCSYSSSCRNTCSKCYNNNNTNNFSTNCNTCSCTYSSSCRNSCNKCYRSNSGSTFYRDGTGASTGNNAPNGGGSDESAVSFGA